MLQLFAGERPVGATAPTMSVLTLGWRIRAGITFGADGQLCVAEGGLGGSGSSTTPQECEQVPHRVGPCTAGMARGRLSLVDLLSGTKPTWPAGFPQAGLRQMSAGR
jgi:hypothetical protein